MKGLPNEGNTCYLNAALQCLLHVPGLTNYALSGWADKDLAKKRINACGLARQYLSLTASYWAHHGRDASAAGVRAALAKLHKPFANAKPHDAHEAMTLLLKHLHDALGRTPAIEPSYARRSVDVAAWDEHVKAEGYSILTELVRGQVRCTVAGEEYESVTHEHFVGLTLEPAASLGQALDAFLAPAHVEGFVVEGRPRPVVLTKTLVYAPLVLVVHLRRPSRDVECPAVWQVPTAAAGVDTYHLFAACMHADGHYTAACEAGGAWRLMDDASVTQLREPPSDLLRRHATVLLYKKKLL